MSTASQPTATVRALAIASPLALLGLWWLAGQAGWAPPQILAAPEKVVAAVWDMARSGELGAHLAASLGRLIMGFALGALAGLAYGVIVASAPVVEDFCGPTFNAIRTVPSIAFIPILILMFGVGETFKILIIAKAAFFAVGLATLEGVRGIPRSYLEVTAALNLPPWLRLTKVLIPAALPSVVTGVRLGLGRSWGVLVAAELIVSEVGLGQMMELGRQLLRLDVVMAGVMITGLIGFGLDASLRRVEARLSSWRAGA